MKGPERISSCLRLILSLRPLLVPSARMACVSLGTSRRSIGGCLRPGTIRWFLIVWSWRLCRRSKAGRLCLALSCLRRSIDLAVAGTQAVCIIFEPLLRISQDLVRSLNGLELGIEFLFPSGVSVRMILESYVNRLALSGKYCWRLTLTHLAFGTVS